MVLGYFFSPYYSLFNLYVALATSDREEVERRVEWAPFRQGIMNDLDRFFEIQMKKQAGRKDVDVSWQSVNVSKGIAEKMATPEGVIYLFNQPDDFLDQIRRIVQRKEKETIQTPSVEKKEFEPEGPNISDLWDRFDYVFFTGISEFSFRFKEQNRLYGVLLKRTGFSWKVFRLQLPVEQI